MTGPADEVVLLGPGEVQVLSPSPSELVLVNSDIGLQGPPGVGLDDLAEVASTGSYNDLINKPAIPTQYTDTQAAAAAPVQSVGGKTGAVTLTRADVGLPNVTNPSDASKPVSTAQQAALNGKANTSHSHAESDI